jgi:protein SCO1/2
MRMDRAKPVMRALQAMAVLALAGLAGPPARCADSAPGAVRRTEAVYSVPDIRLKRQDGLEVNLASELDDGRPVFLNFIYTSCTTTCPLSSQVFSSFQHRLGAGASRVHLVSVSIDPEQDTPARLRSYAAGYSAGAGWQFYTGSVAGSIAAQRAFDVYRGDKMNHVPVVLVRGAGERQWIRLEGLVSPDALYREYQSLKSNQLHALRHREALNRRAAAGA